jgi:hypothetical protein
MPNRKIVFVTYGGGHVNMLVPVIKELQKRLDLDLVVMGLTTAKAVLESNDISCIGFKDLLKDNNDYAREWGEKLVNRDAVHNLVSYEESIAYMGLSYVEMEHRLGAESANNSYKEKGRAAFLPINVLEEFLHDVKPDLVVTTISPRAEEAAVYASRNIGVPCICLVDLFAIPSLKRASQLSYADRVCVISDDVKNLMVSFGRDAQSIVVTGNPAFDKLRDSEINQKVEQLRMKKKWEGKKVILWASQIEPNKFHNGIKGNSSLPLEIERELIDFTTAMDDFHLVIRPHPNESYEREHNNPCVEICDNDIPLNVLLKAVDIVVIMTSTIGLEARLLGTPVVSVDLSVFSNDTPYSKLKISTGVSSLSDLGDALLNVLNNNNKDTVLGFPEVGKYTKNVVSVINEFV